MRWGRLAGGIALLMLGIAISGTHAAAQTTTAVASDAAPEVRLQAAIDLLDEERTEAAIPLLQTVVAQDAAFVGVEQGAAAYWMGEAYRIADRPDDALRAWADGVSALREAGVFDMRLADAYIRHVFAEASGLHYERAGEAYLNLIGRAGHPLAQAERSILREHLRALRPILPPPMRERTGLAGDDSIGTLPVDAGAQLVQWWRSQDAVPATAANERLEAHLERVVHAWQQYQTTGVLDARGDIYIRLGAPYKQTTIGPTSAQFRRKVLNRNATLHATDYPDNEFWVYRQLDPSLHFLFVETRSNYYSIGKTHDLIPSTLKNGLTRSPRGQRLSRAYVRSMAEMYSQLALYHEDFAFRYQRLANYADLIDIAEFTGQWPAMADHEPATFAQIMRSQIRLADEQTARRRRNDAPRSHFEPSGTVDALPVSVRTARFLDADGTTRTQVYWSAPTAELTPSKALMKELDRSAPPEHYYLAVSLVQKAPDYQAREVVRRRLTVSPGSIDSTDVIQPQAYTVAGDTGRYHLAAQWEAYIADSPHIGSVRLGPRIKFGAYRQDSLQALPSDPNQLVMSDLKPLFIAPSDTLSQAQLGAAPPYPFGSIPAEGPLALYFEVYHLGRDSTAGTRYAVEYEVTRTVDGGLLRRDEEQRTAGRTVYEGASRTAREYVVLDLSQFEEAAEGLAVTVRVTDETTGQTVSRTLDFGAVERRR
mgnify:CR=1 FL=1